MSGSRLAECQYAVTEHAGDEQNYGVRRDVQENQRTGDFVDEQVSSQRKGGSIQRQHQFAVVPVLVIKTQNETQQVEAERNDPQGMEPPQCSGRDGSLRPAAENSRNQPG